MSIPKEPRQLMVNIMYLVLTALLALNVSAEIFNAFKVLDQGLVKSSLALDYTNAPMQNAIMEAAKAKPSLQTYADRVAPIRKEAKELVSFITRVKDSIIYESGGYKRDPETQLFTNDLLGEKNIDVTTRILVDDPSFTESNTAKGEELKERLLSFKLKMMDFIDSVDQVKFEKEIAVAIDDKTWREKGKVSWAHMNFDKMPVQAVIPMINKYINDVKSTEAAALNYLGNKVGLGQEDIVLDGFTVVAAPEKSYVIKGEPYNADIFLTAFAGSDSGTEVKLSVNGRPLRMGSDGKAQYTVNTNATGPQTFTAVAEVFNPVTETTKKYKQEFSYEVGERSVAISPTKMNVFYIGVDNPVDISAAGVNSNTMTASMSGPGGGKIKRAADGSFIVNVSTPTRRNEYAKVNVVADGMNVTKEFRVKRIPDPIPMLSESRGGAMSSAEFKIQKGVFPVLKNFDFEADCKIESYRIVRVPRAKDPMVANNRGARFNDESKAVIGKARASDKFYFENIMCRCPGDNKARDLGMMSFVIR